MRGPRVWATRKVSEEEFRVECPVMRRLFTLMSAVSLAALFWTVNRWTTEIERVTTPGSYFHKLAELDPGTLKIGPIHYGLLCNLLAFLPALWFAWVSYMAGRFLWRKLFPKREPRGFPIVRTAPVPNAKYLD